MNDFEDKVAFVTGGDSGIGLGIARALVNAGMKVAISYRTMAHLDEAMKVLEHAGNRVHPIHLDVTSRAAVFAAADETVRIFGKVHVLINNAGVLTTIPLSNATFDDWDWCIGVNLTGVFNCVRAFLPHIKSHGEGGHIVSTSSMQAGLFVGPYWGLYSTSKFAIVGMMEALRSELSNTNIGVSVYCPAFVRSNIGSSNRNRPAALDERGAPDPTTSVLIDSFDRELHRVMDSETEWNIESTEAGEWVLQGIRNDDLYIISNPEYGRAIRFRCDALLASIPICEAPTSRGRLAMAQIFDASVYVKELNRKTLSPTRRLLISTE